MSIHLQKQKVWTHKAWAGNEQFKFMPYVPFGFVYIKLSKCRRAINAARHLGVHLHSNGAYTRLHILGLTYVSILST